MNENQSNELKSSRKSKDKKAVYIILAVMALIVVISIPVMISSLGSGDDGKTEESTRLIYFETPDFEENIFEDAEYMDKNRLVYVIEGPIGTYVDTSNNDERDSYSNAVKFMFDFIDCQIMGDTDGYNACFSAEYIAEEGKKAPFTMQKLYDISLEQYGSAKATDDGGYDYTFILRYKIMKNNGTLRNDIESMSERPLFISVHEDTAGSFAIELMRAR